MELARAWFEMGIVELGRCSGFWGRSLAERAPPDPRNEQDWANIRRRSRGYLACPICPEPDQLSKWLD